eukprot:scaffold238683_cov27-Tisochrysis_lutea.AAC.1
MHLPGYALHQAGCYLLCSRGVQYIVPESNGDTICHSPSSDRVTWRNETDPTTGLTSLMPLGVEAADRWSYHCDASPSEAFPFGQFCTPFRNPGAGDLPAGVPGYNSYDNILLAWIAVLQHVRAGLCDCVRCACCNYKHILLACLAVLQHICAGMSVCVRCACNNNYINILLAWIVVLQHE